MRVSGAHAEHVAPSLPRAWGCLKCFGALRIHALGNWATDLWQRATGFGIKVDKSLRLWLWDEG